MNDKTKQALELALVALTKHSDRVTEIRTKDDAITAIREALAQQPAQQKDIDWKDQYEKQKRRAEMWVAKYEADIKPLEKAGPVTAQQQEPVAWFELLREARDNCKASIVEEGISASRKKYRIDLEARLTAALNTSPPAKPWVNPSLKEYEEIILANMTPKNLDEREAVIGALNDMVVLLKEKNQ